MQVLEIERELLILKGRPFTRTLLLGISLVTDASVDFLRIRQCGDCDFCNTDVFVGEVGGETDVLRRDTRRF